MTNSRGLLGAMMLMAIPFGAAASAASPSGGHRLVPDLAYIQGASATAYERERCTLDLYIPNGVDGFPTVVDGFPSSSGFTAAGCRTAARTAR